MPTNPMILILFHFICNQSLLTAQTKTLTTAQNQVVEWAYMSVVEYKNPFQEVDLFAIIKTPNQTELMVPAYWSGENEWRFRFASPEIGEYTFTTVCSDHKNHQLHDQKGSIRVIEYKGSNALYRYGPLKCSTNGRYFVHYDEKPFLWLADSWWHGMTSRFKWPEDFQHLTADRKKKGFKVVQFAIGFPCDIEPFDSRGQNEAGDPWNREMTSINPAYFELVDLRIQWLLKEGLVPNIVGAWGYYMKWFGIERMKQHYTYLIARYGAYPITWTLCGESTLAYYPDLHNGNWDKYKAQFRDQWSVVAQHIKNVDPYRRLLTVHPGPGTRDGLPPINEMEHIDFIMVQPGHNGYQTLPYASQELWKNLNEYADRPVMYGEVCFEGMWGKSLQDVQRYLFWSSMLSGAPGFCYGVEGIWQFNSEEELFGASPVGDVWGNVPWEVAYKYLGSTHVGLGKKILSHLDWQILQPFPEGLNKHANGEDVFQPFCTRTPDDMRVIYFFNAIRNIRVQNLHKGGFYNYTFFDPLTGENAASGTLQADDDGQWNVPKEPIKQDWVLVIEPK